MAGIFWSLISGYRTPSILVILHSPPPNILYPQMDARTSHSQHGQPQSEREGWLIAFLVFVMRSLIVCICAVARSIVITAGDRIPESLFDHPYLTGFFTDYIPPQARQTRQHGTQTSAGPVFVPFSEGHRERAATPAPAPLIGQHQPQPSSSSTYAVFVGRDVGYTRKRRVISPSLTIEIRLINITF